LFKELTADDLIDALEEAIMQGRISGEVSGYSGRAMHGERCVSFAPEYGGEWELAAALSRTIDLDDLGSPSVDSLGRGVILYWRHLKWPEGRKDG